MLQYKTLLAESKTPLLLAQKEIASLQKELDAFRKAVDAKAKEKDAMERAAKFAKAETEKVCERRPYAIDASMASTPGDASAGTPSPRRHAIVAPRPSESASGPRNAPNRPKIKKQTTHDPHSRRRRAPSSLGAPRPHLSTQAEKRIVVTETRAKEQERIAYSLEAEMATFKNETVKQRKRIYQLEKERERYGVEAAEQRNLCDRRVLRCSFT